MRIKRAEDTYGAENIVPPVHASDLAFDFFHKQNYISAEENTVELLESNLNLKRSKNVASLFS